MQGTLKDIYSKDGIYYPSTTDDVKNLIRFATEKNIPIRTIGAGHSPDDAIVDTKNKNQLKLILRGELRKILRLEPDASKHFAIVSVGAGCHLGVNPRDPESTWENSFNYQVDQAGYALPTLGGISHQTIAGFLQTSSSGGSTQHGIADVIESIEWVNGKGELCKANKGEDLFNAVVVSMGLFGIITNVTFKLPKRYFVEGIEVNRNFEDSLLAPDANGHYKKLEQALFGNKHECQEYIHINWLAQKHVNRTMEWTGKAVAAEQGFKLKPYKHILKSSIMTALSALVLKLGNFIDRNASQSEVAIHFKAMLLRMFANPKDSQPFLDVWYKTLPIDDQVRVHGLIKTSFSELWFPQSQLDEVMYKLDDLLKQNFQAAGNFIVEIYAAKKSPFWLSPSYGHNAVRVDLYWWDRNRGDANNYFAIFWNALLNIPGARLHWGKHLPLPDKTYLNRTYTTSDLTRHYPRIQEWLALRASMDPKQLFVTPYWRQVFNIAPVMHEEKINFTAWQKALRDEKLPAAIVDLDAFNRNVDKIAKAVKGTNKTIRIATKSIRVPDLIRHVLDKGRPFKGVMCYTVEEAAYLYSLNINDLLIAYPTLQQSDLKCLRKMQGSGAKVALVLDSQKQMEQVNRYLNEIDKENGGGRDPLPIVIEIDMSLRLLGRLIYLGVRRSPIRSIKALQNELENSKQYTTLKVVGVLAYEAIVAGLPDSNPFSRLFNPFKRFIRNRASLHIKKLRQQIPDVFKSANVELQIFNGGGTGSINYAAEDEVLNEITVGSGLLCSHLFDYYSNLNNSFFQFEPAAFFALQTTRSSDTNYITCLGGGYIASGEPGWDRLPIPVFPAGLELTKMEGCGEVQTPLRIQGEIKPLLGEPIFFRHSKAGELAEHFNEYLLVTENEISSRAKTYRGAGHCFL